MSTLLIHLSYGINTQVVQYYYRSHNTHISHILPICHVCHCRHRYSSNGGFLQLRVCSSRPDKIQTRSYRHAATFSIGVFLCICFFSFRTKIKRQCRCKYQYSYYINQETIRMPKHIGVIFILMNATVDNYFKVFSVLCSLVRF